jgi:lipoprotein-anchoring transpeptidase ErfK/SrfK
MRRSRHLAAGAVFAATVSAAAAVASAPAVDRSAKSGAYAQGTEIAAPRNAMLALHAGPRAGRIMARVGARTAFGSPTRLAVVQDRGGWVAVVSDVLGNGVQAYARAAEVRLARKPYVLDVDLSRRVLIVRRWGLAIRRIPVTIGAASSPTPTGRFSVTDELSDFYPSVYGCCVLALSAHQTRLPKGWSGGDRVAIHGGGGIGSAVSNGCLHADEADLRYLMTTVPLGTLVVIHP